jgi:ketosteroid isomerase-like protein
MGKSLDLVNRFLSLASPKGRDIQALLPEIAKLFAEDLVFTGPLTKLEGRDKYIGLLGRILAVQNEFEPIRQFEDGDEVCSIHAMTVTTPTGNRLRSEVAEWFKIRNGVIAEHKIYYDPREFMKAFGM